MNNFIFSAVIKSNIYMRTEKIIEYSCKIGLEYLTLYAFSTENWKRPESEVSGLLNLLNSYWGSGAIRGEPPKRGPRRCYNSLMNAASLLWIAEAVGVDELTVRQAFEAAVAAGDYRRVCGAIRKIILVSDALKLVIAQVYLVRQFLDAHTRLV